MVRQKNYRIYTKTIEINNKIILSPLDSLLKNNYIALDKRYTTIRSPFIVLVKVVCEHIRKKFVLENEKNLIRIALVDQINKYL